MRGNLCGAALRRDNEHVVEVVAAALVIRRPGRARVGVRAAHDRRTQSCFFRHPGYFDNHPTGVLLLTTPLTVL